MSEVISLQSSPSWESPFLNQQAQTLPASILVQLWLQAAESQRKVNFFPVTSDVAQSADILLQFFYLVTQISNQSKHSAGKDTISFRLNLSKRSQTVLAASEVKICIFLLELSPSQGLCCTGVVAPVSAQTVPHRHC